MNKKIYGIFVAGGSGTRMGGNVPKQFVRICGKTILQHTIERFKEAIPEMNVITVLPEARIGEWRSICLEGAMNCPQILVEGGLTRYHSVKNALGKVPDGAVVAVHDGVRPMVSVNLIREMLGKMDDCQALIPVVPVVDTLRGKDSGSPSADRESLVAVQTPQFFLSEKIKEAYGQPFDVRFTDDASVVERIGVPISYIEGEKYNFKITTPEDLVVARLILSASCSL